MESFYLFFSVLVFIAARKLALVGATLHCSTRASHCGGFSCCRAWALRRATSVVVVQGHCCSATRRIFLDQGSNLCPLHWQVDSYPLDHQGNPQFLSLILSGLLALSVFYCVSFNSL